MISAVLDANVLVSAFPSKRGAPAALIDRWLDREFRLVTSDHVLDAVARAWSKPWFQQRFAQHEEEFDLIVADLARISAANRNRQNVQTRLASPSPNELADVERLVERWVNTLPTPADA